MHFKVQYLKTAALPGLIFFLLLFFHTEAAASDPWIVPFGQGMVFGFITDNDTGLPIEGAEVISSINTHAVADSAGFFHMVHPSGEYDLTAFSDGYAGHETKYFLMIPFGLVFRSFAIEKYYQSPKIIIYPETGTLYGRVADLYTREGLENVRLHSNNDTTIFTLAGGFYTVTHRAGKNLTLAATADNYALQIRHFDLEAYGQKELNFYLDDNSGSNSTCFLEDLFGSDSRTVQMLKQFRDEVLKESALGREIIRRYYQLDRKFMKNQ